MAMVQFDTASDPLQESDRRAQEEERYIQQIAPTLGYGYVYLRGYSINPEAIPLLSEERARDLQVVCFDLKQKNISLGAKNPNSPKVQALVQEFALRKYTVTIYMCSTLSLEHAWKRYADVNTTTAKKKGVLEIDTVVVNDLTKQINAIKDLAAHLQQIRTANSSRRTSETLELIFGGALALKASDIHIEPEEGTVRVRYRFDGVLQDVLEIDSRIYERILSRLKLLSGMILNSKKAAQDGRFTFEAGERDIEIRSSIIPGSVGESIVMRILDPTVASFSMDNLRLNDRIKAAIKNELRKPNGLIITTGPTGSGKTTALYAFLQEAHNDGVKIITIENPVEYKLDGIVQTQVGDDYTFASGLKAILRQDPDIIMIGEVRDHDVAETAIHAAQTGHLVFTTLHTNSAAAGFARLMDMGIDPRIFGTSINIMLGQRLVRILCTACKEAYTASPAELARVKDIAAGHPDQPPVPEPLTLYRSSGCEACGNTGFKGRAAILEGVIMDDAVEEAVIRDPREHIILEAAKPQMLPTMTEDGIEKVLAGITSLAELGRVVELPLLEQVADPTPTKPDDSDDAFLSHVI
jgi:type II secretory ATPase GspE/PulE/Tfp pilus assembly ATPase PilB-like protein